VRIEVLIPRQKKDQDTDDKKENGEEQTEEQADNDEANDENEGRYVTVKELLQVILSVLIWMSKIILNCGIIQDSGVIFKSKHLILSFNRYYVAKLPQTKYF
jgi:hypothetical protein